MILNISLRVKASVRKTLVKQKLRVNSLYCPQNTLMLMCQKENNNRIPFTLTFHPHNHAVKSIILKNFKLLQNDPDTGVIFSQPPLISFKRDKNIGNFLVRSAFQTSNQAGTFK